MPSQTLRPFLSGLYRKKLIFEFSGQFNDVPLHPGKGLHKAPAIELNFLRRSSYSLNRYKPIEL